MVDPYTDNPVNVGHSVVLRYSIPAGSDCVMAATV